MSSSKRQDGWPGPETGRGAPDGAAGVPPAAALTGGNRNHVT
ncbi:hypothetical protein ACIP6X_39125 [Streptomyces coeruleorubidus]